MLLNNERATLLINIKEIKWHLTYEVNQFLIMFSSKKLN